MRKNIPRDYKAYVRQKLGALTPIFAKASVGDFASDVGIPDEHDEFMGLYVGVQKMIVVIRKQIVQLSHESAIKTEFLMLAAHQLRTPLTAIRWSLETLLEEYKAKLPKDIKGRITEIYRSSLQMIELINDLLNITQFERGEPETTFRLVDPLDITRRVFDEAILFAKEKAVTLKNIVCKNEIPKIMTDPKYLHEAISNLVSNAIKYNKTGGSVCIELEHMNHRKVTLCIKDTGIGIPKKERKKIFTRFFRGTHAALKEPEGTGLGLFFVKAFVESTGGRIWFECEENKETRFYLELLVVPKKHTGVSWSGQNIIHGVNSIHEKSPHH